MADSKHENLFCTSVCFQPNVEIVELVLYIVVPSLCFLVEVIVEPHGLDIGVSLPLPFEVQRLVEEGVDL